MSHSMIGRISLTLSIAVPFLVVGDAGHAQDIPGIEICTVEKTMERRTGCLQSNVEFLQKTISRLIADHQQKLDAAKAQVEGLKATVVSLQKAVEELQAAQKKFADEPKKADTPGAKDAAATAKQGGK